MLKLIDVSHWQGSIDFDKVAASGISGVIVKCIDGRLPSIDPRFAENWRALKERPHLVRGSYAFARPETDGGGEADGRREAEDYARVMLEHDDADASWIAAVDLERSGMDPSHSVQRNIDFLGAWVDTCSRLLGRLPWLYTGAPTWRERMGWTTAFTHLKLWQADYTKVPATMPWPRTMWQYTSGGEVDGVVGRVDLNRFDGSLDELVELSRPGARAPQRGPIFPPLDLAGGGPYSLDVALVQGLLLARGHGPEGLVDRRTGRPDGLRGPATRAAYARATGTSSTRVDWTMLLGPA